MREAKELLLARHAQAPRTDSPEASWVEGVGAVGVALAVRPRSPAAAAGATAVARNPGAGAGTSVDVGTRDGM